MNFSLIFCAQIVSIIPNCILLLYRDFKFFSTKTSKNFNFLDFNIEIVDNNLVFDIYYETTNSYSYIPYTRCQLSSTTQITIYITAVKKTHRCYSY